MLIVACGGIAVVVWVLHKIGQRARGGVGSAGDGGRGVPGAVAGGQDRVPVVRWAVVHWRTTLGVTVTGVWVWWWGWLPVAVTVAAIGAGLLAWRWRHRTSFETWAGRWLRSWWLRWTIYAPRLPGWLHNCGLTIRDPDRPIVLTANPFGRNKSNGG